MEHLYLSLWFSLFATCYDLKATPHKKFIIMTSEGTTIAIDFGSTKIVTAYLNKNGLANIIVDPQTNRAIFNAIQIRGEKILVWNGDDYAVGKNAKHTISGADLKFLITNNNLDSFSLMRTETMPSPTFLVDDQEQEHRFPLMQLIELLLAKVKENAEDSLKTEVKQCIITVPTCYTPQQRLMMQDAGKMVGFEKVEIIDDTTAAALTYVFEKKINEDPHKILVIDVGATSTEAAIILFENSSITVQASKGAMNLGGNNFDVCLLKHFAKEFKTKTGVDLGRKQYELSTFRSNCEELKKRLSSAEKAKVTTEVFHNGQPYDLQLTRTEFEALCDDIFTRIMNVVKEVLNQTEKSSIEKVILVGGGSRLPKIQKELVSLMKGKHLSRILNQNEATATGAAYYTLNKIDIKKLTTHDNDKDFKSELNLKELRQFLFEVQDDDKAFNAYKSERVNLEALCYRFKRELKHRNLDDKESKTILNKCNETLLWIKQTDYNNPTTIEMVKEKAIQLTKVDTNVPSQLEKKDNISQQEVKIDQSSNQKIFQQGITFYKNGEYSEASNIFTELLNSEEVKDIHLECVRVMRAYCYLQMKQYQLCIDDLNLIQRTDKSQKIYDAAEQSLYQEKALKARVEMFTIIRNKDTMEQVCALSVVTKTLENKPQNQSISNIRNTSTLLFLKAMYNFVLENYSEAILDIYENMKLIDDIPELTSQKKELYEEVFEKQLDILKIEMKKNNDLNHLQGHLSYIEKCLKDSGSSSNWLTKLFFK